MRPGTPVSARSSWLVRPLIVLWLLVFSTLTLAAGSPVKSPNDNNDCRARPSWPRWPAEPTGPPRR